MNAQPAPAKYTPILTIFTDGSCLVNPGGPGGYAAVIIEDDPPASDKHTEPDPREIVGGEDSTTNNRMELMGAIAALEALPYPSKITIYSDSQYLIKGITIWYKNWIKKGRKDYKNPDLWKRLSHATQRHQIKWQWVKGHSGVPGNERADELALQEAISRYTSIHKKPPSAHVLRFS